MIINLPRLQTIYSYILTISRIVLAMTQSPDYHQVETSPEEEKSVMRFSFLCSESCTAASFLTNDCPKRNWSVTGQCQDLSPSACGLTAPSHPIPSDAKTSIFMFRLLMKISWDSRYSQLVSQALFLLAKLVRDKMHLFFFVNPEKIKYYVKY